MQTCLGGDKKEESSGSGFNPGDLVSLATGAKEDNNSGLNIGNVISGLTGDKKEEEGGEYSFKTTKLIFSRIPVLYLESLNLLNVDF